MNQPACNWPENQKHLYKVIKVNKKSNEPITQDRANIENVGDFVNLGNKIVNHRWELSSFDF